MSTSENCVTYVVALPTLVNILHLTKDEPSAKLTTTNRGWRKGKGGEGNKRENK